MRRQQARPEPIPYFREDVPIRLAHKGYSSTFDSAEKVHSMGCDRPRPSSSSSILLWFSRTRTRTRTRTRSKKRLLQRYRHSVALKKSVPWAAGTSVYSRSFAHFLERHETLAEQVMAAGAHPKYAERIRLWTEHNSLQRTRPLVRVSCGRYDAYQACSGCHADVLLKDIQTVQGEPKRLQHWARIAKTVAEDHA